MTKKEIVKTISEECGLTQLKTKEVVQKTFEAIIDTLVGDSRHRIELRNFGVFEVKKRAARKARNPRTGERVEVAEKYVVTFKPGKEMEEKVLLLEKMGAILSEGHFDGIDDDDDDLPDNESGQSVNNTPQLPNSGSAF
ncbi:MAG: integration host factor subunit beta [Planctomycetota bacterium]|nr:MAG: integration host factor subunit beta [Planctomycetota bacterium]